MAVSWCCFSRARLVVVLVTMFWCLVLMNVTEAIWMTIPSSGRKCVTEEIENNVVVLGDYYVINDHHPHYTSTVTVSVTSQFGNSMYHKENVTSGQFAFTTSEPGTYEACFSVDNQHQHQQAGTATLNVDWRIGIAAKDWDSVAKKEKIEGVELELRKLQENVGAIINSIIHLKLREVKMREVSEQTNARVAWYSLMSIGICISVSVIQLWHLQHFFQKKKLI